VVTVAGCAEPVAPPPDRTVVDLPAEAPDDLASEAPVTSDAPGLDASPDASPDVSLDALMDASLDADAGFDAAPDVPRPILCGLDVVRPPMRASYNGFLRFVNLARGVGTVRFMVRTLPLYRRGYAEAVVPEGETSGYLEALGVSYQVRVAPAPGAAPTSLVIESDDGGLPGAPDRPDVVLTPCDAGAEGDELTDALCADVYFMAGCTVVLSGSRLGDRDAGTHLRLWSATDLQRRTEDCDAGTVRVIPAYVHGPSLDVDLSDGTVLARGAAYLDRTALRAVRAGPATVEARGPDGGVFHGGPSPVAITPGHPHTLYVWGDARDPARPGAAAALLDDLPLPLW